MITAVLVRKKEQVDSGIEGITDTFGQTLVCFLEKIFN
jgi:hypothetical protein